MIELGYKINGATAATPKNAGEIKLISDWENNEDGIQEAEVSTNLLQLVLEDARVISDHVSGGLTGTSQGIFEGIPYKIDLHDLTNKTQATILDGYVDLADEATFISCDEIEASVKKRRNLDWLTDRADGISFGYLASVNAITTADYVRVPYSLNHRPEGYALVMIGMSIYMTTQALAQAIKATADAVADLIEVLSIGLTVDVGDAIAAGLRVVANLIYTLALVVALVSMIEQLIDQLFPPVRRYYGMPLLTMFERGFQFLGLTFSSTIFNIPKWKNTIYLPQKSEKGGILGKVNGVGHPSQGSAVYNFGDFLRVFKSAFNAEIRIIGSTVHFEREDYWDNQPLWTLPDVETDQQLRLSSFKYNTNEILSNFMISFQTDFQDENTLEDFKGTNFQAITEPKTFNNRDLVNIKGLGEVRLPFARAKRKDSLTVVEASIAALATLVDTAINVMGGSSSLSAKIRNRKSMMVLSADTTGVDKLLVMSNEKIPANDADQLNAVDFWGFHAINSFAPVIDPITGVSVHNQYKLYDKITIPFCYQDWLTLLGNNKFLTTNGDIGKVTNIEWDIHNETANISYKIKHLYTKNLKLAFNEGK
jgi:hypothetical protein